MSRIANSLLRVTTPTANTLTAIAFNLRVQVETLRYLVLYSTKLYKKNIRDTIRTVQYYSCVLLFVSISEVLLYGLSTRRGGGVIGGEIRYMI